jgi:hypothetical protein
VLKYQVPHGSHIIGPAVINTDIDTSVKNDYSPIFGVQVGADTYALRTELGPGHTPPKKYKKPKSGSQNN